MTKHYLDSLDNEEQEILDAFDNDHIQPIPNAKEVMQKHQQYAENTFQRDHQVDIPLSNRDLIALKKLALSEGIPYQIFMSSILHKFAEGKYIERNL